MALEEGKIAKPAKMFAWIGGIIFLLVGVLSFFFLIILFLSKLYLIPDYKGVAILYTIGGVIFLTLGIILILVAKEKWIPKIK